MDFYESLEESCVRIGVDYRLTRERIEKVLGGETVTNFYISRPFNPKEEKVEPLLCCVLILDSLYFGGLTVRKNKDVELSLFRLADLDYLTLLYSEATLEVRFGFLGSHEYPLVGELGKAQEILRFANQVKKSARTFQVITNQALTNQTETTERNSL